MATLLASSAAAHNPLQEALARVAEEAEAFRVLAPRVLGEETLHQKATEGHFRFRPRVGKAALQPPPRKIRMREIVSEYGYSTFKESPNVLHEFRDVVSVDGRRVKDPEKARQTLTMGVTSREDRLKKRLLKNFEKHGLKGAATDFGQIILLFTKRRLMDYQFQFAGAGRIGSYEALGWTFRQTDGKEAVTVFEGRKVIRRPLQGELWVRESDFLPIQIRLAIVRERDEQTVRDEATVDYAMSPHGLLLPTSVLHREFAANELVVENHFEYSSFRMFSAEADIKFTEVPSQSPKQEPLRK
jgi:hypothetical protein